MPKGKDISDMLTNGAIVSTFRHSDPHTDRGRFTLKDGVVAMSVIRYGSFRKKNRMILRRSLVLEPEPEIKWAVINAE